MRSAAARGEEADLVSARKGCSKLMVSEAIPGGLFVSLTNYLQGVESLCLLHFAVGADAGLEVMGDGCWVSFVR